MKIGFLCLGDKGLSMARRLARTGHELVVWNRNRCNQAMVAANMLYEGATK